MAASSFRGKPRRGAVRRGKRNRVGRSGAQLSWPFAAATARRFLAGGRLLPGVGGLSLFGIALLGLPLNAHHLTQFQALNRELGKLCARPPVEAQAVCRLHARLVSSL